MAIMVLESGGKESWVVVGREESKVENELNFEVAKLVRQERRRGLGAPDWPKVNLRHRHHPNTDSLSSIVMQATLTQLMFR